MADGERRPRPRVVHDDQGRPIIIDEAPEIAKDVESATAPAEAKPPAVPRVGFDSNGLPMVVDEGVMNFFAPNAPAATEESLDAAAWMGSDLPTGQVSQPVVPGTPDVPATSTGRGRRGAPAVEAAPTVPLTPEQMEKAKQLATFRAEELAFSDPANLTATQMRQSDLLGEMGDAESEALNKAAALRDQHARNLERNSDRIVETMRRNIQEARGRQEDLQAKADALFSQRFDPRRIYHSPDAAANVSLHLGVAVGSMVQAFQAQQFPGSNPSNVALQLVNDVVEQDIAMQREGFRRGQEEVRSDSAMNLAMRELGLGEVEALDFARAASNENIAEQLSAVALQHAGTRAGQEMENMALNLRQRAMELEQGVRAASRANLAQESRRRGGRSSGSQDSPEGLHLRSGYTWRPDDQATAQQLANRVRLDSDNTMMRAVDSSLTSFASVTRQLNDMVAMVRRVGVGSISPAELGMLNAQRSSVIFKLAQINKSGALAEGEMEIYASMLGDTGYTNFTDADLGALLVTRDNTVEDRQSLAETYGIDIDQAPRHVPTSNERITEATETTEAAAAGSIDRAHQPPAHRNLGELVNATAESISGVFDNVGSGR